MTLPNGPGPRLLGTRQGALTLLVATMLIVGQELLFRGMFPLPEVTGFNRIHYQMLAGSHPALRELLERGLVYDRLRLESRPDGFSEAHDLNRYGFRGGDFAITPPRGRRRILLIGDSVTEGQGAPDSGTIAAELTRLAARDQARVEFINLGVIAASLPHLTALTRDAVGLLRPGAVVLVLYANDLPAPPYPAELDAPGPVLHHRAGAWWFPRAAELTGRVVRRQPIYRRWPHARVPFFAPVPDPSNPWSAATPRPDGLDPAVHRAMVQGTLNPWLAEQSSALPGMLSHDFDTTGSPADFLRRMNTLCAAMGVRLLVVYVPFSGVVHPRYAPWLVKLGMDPATAHALHRDPAYRRQNRLLLKLSATLELPFADTTDDLVLAEAEGAPQYWEFDTHPRPAGYATIARRIHRALTRDVH